MSTIKFRGQILDGPRKGEWVYGYYANILGDHLIIDNSGIQYIVDPKTVGQYIGKKEDDGTEIFQGDLYPCIYVKEGCDHISEIVWNPRTSGFTLLYRGKCQQLQVVQNIKDVYRFGKSKLGNIHSNPDLLTQ